jgi:hypothetical protein
MEKYMRDIETKLLKRYKNYLGTLENRRNLERVQSQSGKNSD